jgi:hypothetical protein
MKQFAIPVAVIALLFMAALPPPLPGLFQGRLVAEGPLFVALNGVPERIGVLTSTGTSVNQSTTASPFTITGGTVLEVVCDGAGFLNVGATSSSDYTNANFGRPVITGGSRWFVLRDTDTNLSLDTSGATVNCNVSVMH